MKKIVTHKAVYHSPNCILFTTICTAQIVAASFGTTDLEEDSIDQGGSWVNN